MSTPDSNEPWYNKTGAVFLLCIIFFPVGLYALWKSSKIGKGWKITWTAVIVLLVITAVRSPEKAHSATAAPEATASTTSTTAQEQPAAAEPKNYFFETTDDFKTAFNNASEKVKLGYSISELTVEKGEANSSYRCMLTDNLALLGTMDKSGKVQEVMMMGATDGTTQSVGDLMLCMATVIATVDPSLEPAKRSDILKGLHIIGDKSADFSNLSTKTYMNGIRYYAMCNKVTGFTFGATMLKEDN